MTTTLLELVSPTLPEPYTIHLVLAGTAPPLGTMPPAVGGYRTTGRPAGRNGRLLLGV
jgi:hypothetical protein